MESERRVSHKDAKIAKERNKKIEEFPPNSLADREELRMKDLRISNNK